MTPAQFTAQYARSAEKVLTVVTYLQSLGFTRIEVEPNKSADQRAGTVAQAEQAFHTNLKQYSLNGQLVFANSTPAMVPASWPVRWRRCWG